MEEGDKGFKSGAWTFPVSGHTSRHAEDGLLINNLFI